MKNKFETVINDACKKNCVFVDEITRNELSF